MSDINISSLAQGATAVTSLSNLILVTPVKNVGIQNQQGIVSIPVKNTQTVSNAPGLPRKNLSPTSILFQYEGENTASLESEVTEHYSEKNDNLTDNIALRPETITVHGFVGEVTDEAPIYPEIVNQLRQKLYTLSAYTPGFSATALNAINEAIYAYTIANTAVTAVESLFDVSAVVNGVSVKLQTRQQRYFLTFYNYWVNRTLFTVQTPWAVFNNMVMKSFRAVQNAETRMITDFEITFRRYYAFDSITETQVLSPTTSDGRNIEAVSTVTAQGAQQLNESTTTFNPTGLF
jgi:hypothetical protein